jgi:hypothetical protein
MPVQMWFIAQKGEVTEQTTRELTHAVREQGGLILMMTRTGPLVALDDDVAPVVERHPAVAFMGPVSLNPRGIAADRLQHIFAENLSKQLDLAAFEDLESASP